MLIDLFIDQGERSSAIKQKGCAARPEIRAALWSERLMEIEKTDKNTERKWQAVAGATACFRFREAEDAGRYGAVKCVKAQKTSVELERGR